MNNKTLAALILSALSLTTHAAEYGAVVTDKSTITFTSKQMGVAVQGRFPKYTAKLAIDPAKPEAGKVDISIDVASIDAGSKEANDEVVGKPWFNARAFPTAVFSAKSIKSIGPNKFEIAGPLTIKGKSLPVTAPFTFKAEGANGVFDGAFTIKRTDYGIGEGEWADPSTVANEVQVVFHIVATAAAIKTANPGTQHTK